VTRKTFEREVLASEQPVIVDFWAPWCGPCRAVAPALDQIAVERPGELKVVKVNVDEEPELAARFGISSIPTIVLFEDGKLVAGAVGARGKSQLEQALGLSRSAEADGDRAPGGLRGLIARLARRPS
jgi:thioredoxin 1